jgi:hypothetical protein
MFILVVSKETARLEEVDAVLTINSCCFSKGLSAAGLFYGK